MTPKNTQIRETVITYKGAPKPGPRCCSSKDVAAWAYAQIDDDGREHFLVLGLDAKNRPQAWSRIAIGGQSMCVVEPSAVFRWAVVQGVSALVLIHNHPSGDPAPSPEDRALTQRIKRGGELLGVRVLDHVIVGREGHFSFLDAGLLE